MRRRSTAMIAAFVVALLALSGCTGVPKTSSPEVVRSLDVVEQQGPAVNVSPEPDANPRTIVSGFLQASVDAASGHSAARQFLTVDARRLWQDNPIYVVDDFRVQVPEIFGDAATVVVTARKIGTIDANGEYSPRLEGLGLGNPESFPFRLRKVDGQWRVAQLQPGVLVRRTDFESSFRPRPLYFLDPTESHLVADLRYTSLEGQQLASWLLALLFRGPRPELGTAVVSEIPEQLDPNRVTVTVSDGIKIEIPGSSRIDSASLTRLAAQLAFTFGPIQFAASVQLTDGGVPVDVPGVGHEFHTSDFEDTLGTQAPLNQTVYYVCNGGVCDDSGKPISGPVGTTRYHLSSVALHAAPGGAQKVVGVSGATLLSGTTSTGLFPLRIAAGQFSRPTWQPDTDDIWVASGHTIYRIPALGAIQSVSVSQTEKQSALGPGRIVALRFSPDGVRLAFVLAAPDGTSTVYIGTVVRSGNQIRVESADAVTPPELLVDDVDWSNATSLVLIARAISVGGETDAAVWTVQSDGSLLRGQSAPAGLPAAPTAVAAASGQFNVVSAGGAIWVQRSDSWVSLDRSGSTPGSNPVYPE